MHVAGSQCCTESTNPSSVVSQEECQQRCVHSTECLVWVLQPSSGNCWLGKPARNGHVPVPASDRIAGVHESLWNPRSPSPTTLELLQSLHPRGLGVLLGVGSGEFAKALLTQWDGGVYLVDPYIRLWEGYDNSSSMNDRNHQLVYERLRVELHQEFDNRFVFIRDFPYTLAEWWKAKPMPSPSFIYIDHNQTAAAMLRDIQIWWNVLAPGGLIAGSFTADEAQAVVRSYFTGLLNVWYSEHYSAPMLTWKCIKPLILSA